MTFYRLTKIIFVTLFLIAATNLTAAEKFSKPSLLLLDESAKNRLGLSTVYLEDKNKELDIHTIQRQFDSYAWQYGATNDLTIGSINSTYWFVTEVKAPSSNRDWLIRLNHAGIDLIDVWIMEGDRTIARHTMGASLPFDQRPFLERNFSVPLSMEANKEYQLYFRVSMNGYLDFPLNILTSESFAQGLGDERIKSGIYYGVAIVMALYNLMIFLYSRESAYLFYVLFISSLAVLLAIVDGSAFQYLWPQFPQFNQIASSMASGLTQLFAIIFTGLFLNIRQNSSFLFKLLIANGIMAFLVIISNFILSADVVLAISLTSTLVTFPILLLSGAIMWKKGQYYARYFTIAWAMLCFFCVKLALFVMGISTADAGSMWDQMRMASTLEMVLLAFALAARINFLTREEENARADSNAKTQFIAQISHELRTPMNGVLGMSALLREHLKDKQAIHFNNVIYQSGLALLGTINDVLDAAKIQADKLEIEHLPFNLKEVCEQSFYVIEPQTMVKSLVTNTEFDENIPLTVEGDPNRIRQILLNFLSNAAKFTERGVITLKVECTGKDLIRISVTDSGCGIPTTEQQVLFKPYSQHDSNPYKGKGTGLGLFICKKLIDAMDGKIGVKSTDGNGSSFWFELYLPATNEPPIPLTGQLAEIIVSENDLGDNLNILVAEDNAANQMVIEKLLQKMGHQVQIVQNGLEALQAISEADHSYDLILMDCEMPVMDGYEASSKIRQYEKMSNSNTLPIIALTAHAMQESYDKCIQSGMNEVITKPVRTLSLQQTLKRYSSAPRNIEKTAIS